MTTPRFAASVAVCVYAGLLVVPAAQTERVPSARLVPASELKVPDDVDSNMPMVWDLVDGVPRLFAFASWGGVPSLLAGDDLTQLERQRDAVDFVPHPGHGIWIEAVIADVDGTFYGYYHHEIPADRCGRPDRALLRIGAAKSTDRGATWRDLGPILDAPPDSEACTSANRFVLGGVGDFSVMLDPDRRDLYVFFSEYSRDRLIQGVAVARLAWADRDDPQGKVTVWQDGVWLPALGGGFDEEGRPRAFQYPPGTPLVPVGRPWHDSDMAVDAYWGPSVHWNTYLEQYVMLLNRARNERFDNEGIYISFSRVLDDPRAWSVPTKLMNRGGWYPQVAGLDPGEGTDKQAGQRARFFLTGKSDHMIEFSR